METLKQPQYSPLSVNRQVMLLYASANKYTMDVPVKEIRDFNTGLLHFIDDNHPDISEEILKTGELKPELEKKLKKAIEDYIATRLPG